MKKTIDQMKKNHSFLGEVTIHSNNTLVLILFSGLIAGILVLIQQWMPIAIEVLIILFMYFITKSYTAFSGMLRYQTSVQ